MLFNNHNSISKYFPGPFVVRANKDWFDATYDIICLETGERVAASYFWDQDEEPEARGISEIVTAALNEQAGHPLFLTQPFPSYWPEFKRLAPGPYGISRDHCPGRGPFVKVICERTGHWIMSCHDINTAATPRQTARCIAKSLNLLSHDISSRGKATPIPTTKGDAV